MATATFEEADDRGATTARRSSTPRSSTTNTSLKAAASAINTATILELVERLGLVDMVVERVRGRFEEIDIDELLDEVGDYLKRNPEVLVVTLGAITIATGALVYLNKRPETTGGAKTRSAATASRGSSSTGSKKSRSRK